MDNKKKEKVPDEPIPDAEPETDATEEWLDAKSTVGTEPGMELDSNEKGRDTWISEEEKKDAKK